MMISTSIPCTSIQIKAKFAQSNFYEFETKVVWDVMCGLVSQVIFIVLRALSFCHRKHYIITGAYNFLATALHNPINHFFIFVSHNTLRRMHKRKEKMKT